VFVAVFMAGVGMHGQRAHVHEMHGARRHRRIQHMLRALHVDAHEHIQRPPVEGNGGQVEDMADAVETAGIQRPGNVALHHLHAERCDLARIGAGQDEAAHGNAVRAQRCTEIGADETVGAGDEGKAYPAHRCIQQNVVLMMPT
jgi:hypothetical protein